MSETFHVGDNVVFRDASGNLIAHYGVAQVIASDLSWVVVNRTNYSESYDFKPLEDQKYCWKFNAGTGKYKHDPNSSMAGVPPEFYVSLPNEADAAALAERAVAVRCDDVAELLETALGKRHSLETLETALAVLDGTDRTCQTCAFWRPPFDNHGPGNCHNTAVREMTRMGHETYPPPTPASFGCNQWQAKEQPENGEQSDE